MGRSWRSTSPLFLRNILLVLRTEEGFCRVFPAGSEISLSSLSPLEGKGKLYSLTFFGAKKKKRFSYFLWRRERSKETSTLTKPSPIWEGCNCLRGQAALRQGFGMARKACALRASHGLLHLSPDPSPGREGVAAHRRIEHPTNTNRKPRSE